MTKVQPADFFNKEASQAYDEKNSKLGAIAHNLHFLIQLILKELPQKSRILCIGIGTGAEILSLAKIYPDWTFVGVDPSASMLEVCSDRFKDAGISERCQLVHGYIQDAPSGENFDAVLSVLVAHFVKRNERLNFFTEMSRRLKNDGFIVNAEISYDLNSTEFPSMLTQWKKIQELMGATPESLENLPRVLREMLSIVSPSETENFLRQSGIKLPVRFFQAFMINGWYGKKSVK